MRQEDRTVPATIVIGGPTAIGKSAAALALAQILPIPAEIVSADSLQVYRRFDLGTAKPSLEERALVPHHLIDVAEPDEDFTLADYQNLAGSKIRQLHADGKIALLVGGTGLYVRAVTQSLDIPATPPDPELRARWADVAREHGQAALHDALRAVDPKAADRIHINDTKRIVRALEVFEKTGRAMSSWHEENARALATRSDDTAFYGLDRDRTHLYAAIEARVDAMMAHGFVDEVTALRADGYGPDLKPMQSLGYRQVNEFLDGNVSLDDAVDSIKRETRQYARRQLIWFRADSRLTWINVEALSAEAVAAMIRTDLKTMPPRRRPEEIIH